MANVSPDTAERTKSAVPLPEPESRRDSSSSRYVPPDGKQDGQWTMWYENGARAAVDHCQGGVQDGPHTSWYANGAKSIEGNYRNGRREGVWTRWDPSGLTSHQQTYKDDKVAR